MEIKWGLLSLEYLNSENPIDPRRELRPKVRLSLRLLAKTEHHAGNEAMGRLYGEIAEAYHQRGLALDDDKMLKEALERTGLPLGLLEEAKSDLSMDRKLEAIYEEEVRKRAIGVPSLFIEREEDPFFGPVIDEVPPMEQALELWDLIVALSRHTYFFEIKRSRG
jgi:2-hydroxychromene-2-carboxylate isomerase